MEFPQLLNFALEGGQVGVLVVVSWQLGRLVSALEFHDRRLTKLEE